MGVNDFIAKDYGGGAAGTTLNGAINASVTTINVIDASTWPTGASGPFVCTIERGVPAKEEKIIVTSRAGNVLTVLQRGYDGSTGVSHSTGVAIEHTLDAFSMKQANRLANLLTAKGDLFGRDSSDVQRVAVGSNGQLLTADSAQTPGLKWANLPIDTQVFTVDGTWTKPTGAYTMATIIAIGAGGGGGSGATNAVGTGRTGGGGGGGGEKVVRRVPLSVLGATASVVVGVGGTGGAAQAGSSANGNNGGNATNNTGIAGIAVARSGGGGLGGQQPASPSTGGNSGVLSGLTSPGVPTSSTVSSIFGQGAGCNSTDYIGSSGGTGCEFVAGGGGSGGGVGTAGSGRSGGGGGGGDAAGTNNTSNPSTGTGANGGAGSSVGAGTAGSNASTGAGYGGGGGGGGAALNGSSSGKGGDGAAGICVVICT